MKAGAEVLGLTMVAGDGRRIGTVADLLFDDKCHRVLGFVLRSGLVFRSRRVIGYGEIQSIGPEAIVAADSHPRELDADEVTALATDQRSMQGKPVVTSEGRYVGAVSDVVFDEETGRVIGFEVAKPPATGPWRLGRVRLPDDLSHVVADAVILPDTRAE